MSARLLVLQANDPRHTPPSTKIVAASIIFTLPNKPTSLVTIFLPTSVPLSPTTFADLLLFPISYNPGTIVHRNIRISEIVSTVSNVTNRFSLPPSLYLESIQNGKMTDVACRELNERRRWQTFAPPFGRILCSANSFVRKHE